MRALASEHLNASTCKRSTCVRAQAAVVALALDTLGREAALYDGSWAEWGKEGSGRPIIGEYDDDSRRRLAGAPPSCWIAPACGGRRDGRRRLSAAWPTCLSSTHCDSSVRTSAWFDEWRSRLDDWFKGLPLPAQASSPYPAQTKHKRERQPETHRLAISRASEVEHRQLRRRTPKPLRSRAYRAQTCP